MLEYAEALTEDDFFTGIFAALASLGKRTVSLRGNQFDLAMKKVFDRMSEIAPDQELGFHIQPHPLHQDSVTVRDGVTNAARRDLISLDNPLYQDIRLKIDPTESMVYLENLPGGPGIYLELARVLIDVYPSGVR